MVLHMQALCLLVGTAAATSAGNLAFRGFESGGLAPDRAAIQARLQALAAPRAEQVAFARDQAERNRLELAATTAHSQTREARDGALQVSSTCSGVPFTLQMFSSFGPVNPYASVDLTEAVYSIDSSAGGAAVASGPVVAYDYSGASSIYDGLLYWNQEVCIPDTSIPYTLSFTGVNVTEMYSSFLNWFLYNEKNETVTLGYLMDGAFELDLGVDPGCAVNRTTWPCPEDSDQYTVTMHGEWSSLALAMPGIQATGVDDAIYSFVDIASSNCPSASVKICIPEMTCAAFVQAGPAMLPDNFTDNQIEVANSDGEIVLPTSYSYSMAGDVVCNFGSYMFSFSYSYGDMSYSYDASFLYDSYSYGTDDRMLSMSFDLSYVYAPTAMPTTTLAPTPNALTTTAPTSVSGPTLAPTPNALATTAPTSVSGPTLAPTPNALATTAPTSVSGPTLAPTPNALATTAPTSVSEPTLAPTHNPTTSAPTSSPSPAPSPVPTFAPFFEVEASSAMVFAGFESPEDFNDDYKTAFKNSLVDVCDTITSVDQVTTVSASYYSAPDRRLSAARSLLTTTEIEVSFTVTFVVEGTNATLASAVVKETATELEVAVAEDSSQADSFIAVFDAEIVNVGESTLNITLDVAASEALLEQMEDSAVITPVTYTRAPTPGPPGKKNKNDDDGGVLTAIIVIVCVVVVVGCGYSLNNSFGKSQTENEPLNSAGDERNSVELKAGSDFSGSSAGDGTSPLHGFPTQQTAVKVEIEP